MILTRFIRDRSAATAIEYGLIAGLIGLAALTALSPLRAALDATLTNVAEAMAPKEPAK